MTFSETYNKARNNNEYDFRIVRYYPNGTIKQEFVYYHCMIITDSVEIMKECYDIPLAWLEHDDWKLKLK